MDPLGGVRSSVAQGKAVSKGVKSKIKMGKAMQAKAANLNKQVVLHVLLFFGLGILLGCTIFIPFYGVSEGSVVKLIYVGLSVAFTLLGMLHVRRMFRKIDWADEYRLGPEFLLTFVAALFAALGLFLMHFFIPSFIISMGDVGYFSLMMSSSAIWFLVPFLLFHAHMAAVNIEKPIYPLWYYPKNYMEKQPTWDREKVVYANMVFEPTYGEGRIKKIEVRLPLEANLGEVIYLFINDYNENKSPDTPINNLRKEDKSIGWLFSSPKKLGKLKVGKKYLDPELSIEENMILPQQDIEFERIFSPTD